jgi:hypothetical protein
MSRGEFRGVFEHVLAGQDLGILFSAYSGTQFLGALWLVRAPCVAKTLGYAIEVEECAKISNSLSIGPPLWWRGIEWAKARGCMWLDVWGYSETTPPASPVYQIHQFKKKFRPVPVQVLGEHVYVCNRAVYTAHQAQRFLLRARKFALSLPYQVQTRGWFRRASASREEGTPENAETPAASGTPLSERASSAAGSEGG